LEKKRNLYKTRSPHFPLTLAPLEHELKKRKKETLKLAVPTYTSVE